MKIILIEDRIRRQEKLLNNKLNELNNYKGKNQDILLKNILGGKEFENIRDKFDKKDFSFLDEYDVVMLHRSAFQSEVRNQLIEYLKNKNKTIIFFSGGISGSQYTEKKEFKLLLINSNDFYNNLSLYLGKEAENIMILAFGEKWEVSLLASAIETLSLYMKNLNIEIPYSIFETEVELSPLIKEKYFNEFINNSKRINSLKLNEIISNIKKDLNKLI